MILKMREASGLGPASVREIYEALSLGGYQFGTDKKESAIRGLRISLGKSTKAFHKLPNGSFGLMEWYPEIKPSRRRLSEDLEAEGDSEGAGEQADAEAEDDED
jgi:hypothetical protein